MTFFRANLDVLTISETKIKENFQESQFITKGISEPYRLDRTVTGGGILLYVTEDIPSKCIKGIAVSNSFEGLFIELNLRNKKWILVCSYNTHRDETVFHLNTICNLLDKVCMEYKPLILLDDFNVELEKKHMSEFMSRYNLKKLLKHKTYF